jgi:histidine triad (HIT) family protein
LQKIPETAPPELMITQESPMTTIFSRIVKREVPSEIVFQDELVTAFRDIDPVAPVHILIVPNRVIPTVNDLTEEDQGLAGHMILVAKKVAHQEGIAEKGYRLIINCNPDGGQVVYHLHLHLVGGQPLGAALLG